MGLSIRNEFNEPIAGFPFKNRSSDAIDKSIQSGTETRHALRACFQVVLHRPADMRKVFHHGRPLVAVAKDDQGSAH